MPEAQGPGDEGVWWAVPFRPVQGPTWLGGSLPQAPVGEAAWG